MILKEYAICILCCICILFSNCKVSNKSTSIKLQTTGTLAENAMVSTAHPLASKIGVEVLQKDGNAIDAAVAVQFALAVCYPRAGNIGGGGFMVYRDKNGNSTTLDFRETAPFASTRNMYLDEQGNADANKSQFGALAVGVPGSVAGIFEMHKKYGSMPIEQLIEPAIDLAENGIQLLPDETHKLNDYQEIFKTQNPNNTYLQSETPFVVGNKLIQKDLAETFKRIKINGVEEFYSGTTAKMIVDEMKNSNGIITLEDLKNYKAVWRKPITTEYENYKLISMSPPSSGGIILAQMLKMLSQFDLSTMQHNTANYIHLLAEIERRAYADRATHYGDPDFWEVPESDLLNETYLEKRVETLDLNKATNSHDIKAGNFSTEETEETTHISIIDQFGNAVSITTTLNGRFGSKKFVTGGGFLLNNEMDDFSAKPGSPNLYGLIGGEANAIEPNKRMLSSMTPTIFEKEGNLFLVVGSPGGSTIITSVFQTFLNITQFEMTAGEAANTFRFHHQWLPDQIYFEDEMYIQNGTIDSLNKLGHKTKLRSPIGRVEAILVLPDGSLEGASDFRGEGAALGFWFSPL